MAPGQSEYDAKGFQKVSDTLYRGNSPITGLRAVIEEAIDREIRRNPRLEGQALEAKIAKRLTNLNDFEPAADGHAGQAHRNDGYRLP